MNAHEIINKYQLDKKSWTYKGFHGVLHYFVPVGEMALKPLFDFFGDAFELTIFFVEGNYCYWYWNDADLTRLRNKFVSKVNKDHSYLHRLLDEWHKRLTLFNKIVEKIDQTDFTTLSDEELIKLYYLFYNSYIHEYCLACPFQESFSLKSEVFLYPHFKKIIETVDNSKLNEYYVLLLSPTEHSFLTREYIDRLKILNEVQKGLTITSDRIQSLLKNHAQQYHWIHNNYAVIKSYESKYFENELNKIITIDADKEIKRLEYELNEIKKRKEELIKKLDLNKESKNLIEITEVFAYMQDERKKYVLLSNYYQKKFIVEFGKRLCLPIEDMEYTYIHELENLLKMKKGHNKRQEKSATNSRFLKPRKSFCCYINTLKDHTLITGDIAKEIYDSVFREDPEKIKELKGTAVSSGYAKGKVIILKTVEDLIKMKQSNIIVASMTRPEMTVAMQKAAAIVTDEGGITSHAAIISRELRIPCIIGTKHATKIFKNNDFIEVDADNGVVRKLIDKQKQ